MNQSKQIRHFVIDANVVLLSVIPTSALDAASQVNATAAQRFLVQANLENAVLHVPELFDSEIRNAIYRDGISKGIFTFDDGLALAREILAANWQRHIPNTELIYRLQQAMNRTKSTGDAEFLAVAQELNCPLITADSALVNTVQNQKISTLVFAVTQHPWGQFLEQRYIISAREIFNEYQCLFRCGNAASQPNRW
jgi:predicted nucleic acid-binding protein